MKTKTLKQHVEDMFEPDEGNRSERDLVARLPIQVVEHLAQEARHDTWFAILAPAIQAAMYLAVGLLIGTQKAVTMMAGSALIAAWGGWGLYFWLSVKVMEKRRRRFLKAYGLLHDPPAPPPVENLVRA